MTNRRPRVTPAQRTGGCRARHGGVLLRGSALDSAAAHGPRVQSGMDSSLANSIRRITLAIVHEDHHSAKLRTLSLPDSRATKRTVETESDFRQSLQTFHGNEVCRTGPLRRMPDHTCYRVSSQIIQPQTYVVTMSTVKCSVRSRSAGKSLILGIALKE